MAERRSLLRRNSSFVVPCLNSNRSRAAIKMSTRKPRSRSMDRSSLAQNVVPAVKIAALLHEPAVENVHLATDEPGQLIYDLEPGHVDGTLSGCEADQEVDIAFGV